MGNKLSAYLQDDRGSQRVYWIQRTKHTIIGWFTAAKILNKSLGADCESGVDIHFTYPTDGDLHFSLKQKTSSDGDRLTERVFWNRVRRTTITSGVHSHSEAPRDAADSKWCFLMPRYRLHPLGDYSTQSIFFQFPSAGITIMNGRVHSAALDKLPRSKTIPSHSHPICVSALANGSINVWAQLTGAGAPTWPFPEQKPLWVAHDDTQFPQIHLYALFCPMPEPPPGTDNK